MGLDGCGKEFETWIDHSGLWREDSSFQKVNIAALLNAAWVSAFVFGMRKSLWYMMYGVHVRWEGENGHYIYDLHGVMSIGICIGH